MSEDPRVQAGRRAVEAAGKVCHAVAVRLGEISALTKDDRSPVTVADFASQAVVLHLLADVLGDVPVVGEENADLLRGEDGHPTLELVVDAVRVVWADATADDVLAAIDRGAGREVGPTYWTLDPIDGTKGFLRGGQYAVSLCHVVDGDPDFGVLGCPNLSPNQSVSAADPRAPGSLYWARRDGGAFEVDPRTGDQRGLDSHLTVGERNIRIAESVESGHTRHDHTQAIVDHLNLAGSSVRLDGQGKYAVVARGQADAYLRMPTRPGYREKVWDHAAGVLIAEEAGATVSDITGKALDFSLPPQLSHNRGVICSRGSLHPRILAAIETLDLFSE